MVHDLIGILSPCILGLFVGSLLTEACVLVPFWRSMDPDSFFRHYRNIGPRLQQYFSPLTILATLIPLAHALQGVLQQKAHTIACCVVGGLMIAVLCSYFVYFKSANAGFASEQPDSDGLPDELSRWSRWHNGRTVLAMIAFVLSMYAMP